MSLRRFATLEDFITTPPSLVYIPGDDSTPENERNDTKVELLDWEIECLATMTVMEVEKVSVSEPLYSSLAVVGVEFPQFEVIPKHDVVTRDFTALSEVDATIDGEPILEWSIPPVGCESLMQSQLPNLRIAIPTPVQHGAGYPSVVISALRPKYDGQEAMVIVYTTPSRSAGILLSTGHVERVDQTEPGHYEREMIGGEMMYRILDGPPIPGKNCVESQWYSPTRTKCEQVNTVDGIVLQASGVEYRVKNHRTASFRYKGGKVVEDRTKNDYFVQGCPRDLEIGAIVDCELTDTLDLNYVRRRPDRRDADTSDIVKVVRKTVIVSELMPYLPFSSMRNSPVQLEKPPRQLDVVSYRSMGAEMWAIGPHKWGYSFGDENYAMGSVSRFMTDRLVYSRSEYLAYLRSRHKYLHGSRVRSVIAGVDQETRIVPWENSEFVSNKWWPTVIGYKCRPVHKEQALASTYPWLVRTSTNYNIPMVVWFYGTAAMTPEERDLWVLRRVHDNIQKTQVKLIY